MKIKNNWFVLLFLSSVCFGQEFNFQAKLEKVNYTGFHKIVLAPELLGKLNNYQSDLRVYDSLGIEIPYLHEQEQLLGYQSLFKEYEIVEKHYSERRENLSVIVVLSLDDDHF